MVDFSPPWCEGGLTARPVQACAGLGENHNFAVPSCDPSTPKGGHVARGPVSGHGTGYAWQGVAPSPLQVEDLLPPKREGGLEGAEVPSLVHGRVLGEVT